MFVPAANSRAPTLTRRLSLWRWSLRRLRGPAEARSTNSTSTAVVSSVESPRSLAQISNGPSGGQIMLVAKRLKNYTGYVTTKSRDRGVATSPPRSIICNTVQYEYDYQLGNQYERLRYEYSYDCFFVRFRFTQCNKKYGTRQDPCLQATTPCDRQTDRHT